MIVALCLSFSQALVPNSRPAVSSRRAALGDVSRFALGVAALAAAPLAARADEDVPMSKAKAKIVAAKAIADAKVAERGYANPEAKETKGISMKVKDDVKLSKEQKLMAEAGQQGQKWPRSQQPARPVTAP
tara:strand:+ start:36 stop:428 length:393 start_codon:yes stop_codon:yes gene_type:complete